jgi:hypothetical protein
MVQDGYLEKTHDKRYYLPNQIDFLQLELEKRPSEPKKPPPVKKRIPKPEKARRGKKEVSKPKRAPWERKGISPRKPSVRRPDELIVNAVRPIVKPYLESLLERMGGACHVKVKLLAKFCAEKLNLKFGRKISTAVDFILANDPHATIWDEDERIQERVYALKDNVNLDTTTIADSIPKLLREVMKTPGISFEEVNGIIQASEATLSSAIQRLSDSQMLEVDHEERLRIMPQTSPDSMRTIQLIVEVDSWTEIIKRLIIDHLNSYYQRTGRNIRRLLHMRRYVISQLSFLWPGESLKQFNEAIDSLCIQGILQQIEGDLYRFNIPIEDRMLCMSFTEV